MVVDDQKDLLELTTKMLEQDGFAVHGFDDPIRALGHVKGEDCRKCDTILSDISMPGMSGFELVMKLEELRPEMKIILMTAFNINKEEAQLILPSSKVDALVNKPFKARELVEIIKNIPQETQCERRS